MEVEQGEETPPYNVDEKAQLARQSWVSMWNTHNITPNIGVLDLLEVGEREFEEHCQGAKVVDHVESQRELGIPKASPQQATAGS